MMERNQAKVDVQVISHRGTNEEERGVIIEVLDGGKVRVQQYKNGVLYQAAWDLKDLEVAPTEGMQKKFAKGFKKSASETSGGMTGGSEEKEQ